MHYSDPNTRRDGEEVEAPPKLVAALREPPARRVFVPPAVDLFILNAARRHLARHERRKFQFVRPWIAWPALATACLAIVGLVVFTTRRPSSVQTFAREDINHDGRVDILDAFQLARLLQSETKPAAASDVNHDGVVDWRDAEFIAGRAVKLGKGGRS
ncbi:MAG: hypothetical protein HOP33_15005 [Verrucomicrobia bacterium]|nr:hypothetical protein [Verrucomicrobiota bacterium]